MPLQSSSFLQISRVFANGVDVLWFVGAYRGRARTRAVKAPVRRGTPLCRTSALRRVGESHRALPRRGEGYRFPPRAIAARETLPKARASSPSRMRSCRSPSRTIELPSGVIDLCSKLPRRAGTYRARGKTIETYGKRIEACAELSRRPRRYRSSTGTIAMRSEVGRVERDLSQPDPSLSNLAGSYRRATGILAERPAIRNVPRNARTSDGLQYVRSARDKPAHKSKGPRRATRLSARL